MQGYEGSGRGFLLKFCAGLPAFPSLSLQQPMRWAQDDSLERVINNALLFSELPEWQATKQEISVSQVEQRELCADPQRLRCFYALLSSAPYRTSPLDLRRLMDAPSMHFVLAKMAQEVVGALWLDEGGLNAELAHGVWAGRRQGIARRLIAQQRQQVQRLDFLSVSFGYTEPLWRLWQSCGFELVRISSKLESRAADAIPPWPSRR